MLLVTENVQILIEILEITFGCPNHIIESMINIAKQLLSRGDGHPHTLSDSGG